MFTPSLVVIVDIESLHLRCQTFIEKDSGLIDPLGRALLNFAGRVLELRPLRALALATPERRRVAAAKVRLASARDKYLVGCDVCLGSILRANGTSAFALFHCSCRGR